MSRQCTSLCDRIRDNDPNLTEANLGFEGEIDIPQLTAIFDALCKNTAVKYSAVRVGAFLKLDKSAYDGFARMLSKNKVIEKLTLYLQRQKEIDQLMKAFKDHGDGICLKTINLYMFGLAEATDMSKVVDFLTRWPKAACKVEIRARDGGTNSIIDPEKFLKETVATRIESLTLVGNRFSLKAVLSAMEQPCFRLKGLSISFSDYESTPLFATALEACKSIVSFEMRDQADRHVLARLPAMQNIQKFSVVGLSSCLSLRPVCQAIRAHGNIKTLKLKWEPGWQYEDDVDTAGTVFAPADFEGLEELILKFTCPLVPGDTGISIFNAAVKAVSSSLRDNATIQKVTLDFYRSRRSYPPYLHTFQTFTDTTFPSMPNLREIDFDMILFAGRASLVLPLVRRCRNLQKVTYKLPLSIARQERLVQQEIYQQCEMNRIDYPSLLAAERVSLAVWPCILASVCQRDVFFLLLREKNDVLFVNLNK